MMWCRNSKRIAFSSSVIGLDRYRLMNDVYDRPDMVTFRMPEEYYQFSGAGANTMMPDVIILDDSPSVVKFSQCVINKNSNDKQNYKRYLANQNALLYGFALFVIISISIYLVENSFIILGGGSNYERLNSQKENSGIITKICCKWHS